MLHAKAGEVLHLCKEGLEEHVAGVGGDGVCVCEHTAGPGGEEGINLKRSSSSHIQRKEQRVKEQSRVG